MNKKVLFESLKRRFEKFAEKKEGCWDWRGSFCRGYGNFSSRGKYLSAHRASWIIHCGRIPQGMCVLHKCDNKSCTNPKHLFLGTLSDNARDMFRKNRQGHHTFKRKIKLSNKHISEIKKLIGFGCRSLGIAEVYKIPPKVVYQIKSGNLYKSIE